MPGTSLLRVDLHHGVVHSKSIRRASTPLMPRTAEAVPWHRCLVSGSSYSSDETGTTMPGSRRVRGNFLIRAVTVAD